MATARVPEVPGQQGPEGCRPGRRRRLYPVPAGPRPASATVKGDAIEAYGILQVAPARGGHGAQGPAPETNIPRRPHPG